MTKFVPDAASKLAAQGYSAAVIQGIVRSAVRLVADKDETEAVQALVSSEPRPGYPWLRRDGEVVTLTYGEHDLLSYNAGRQVYRAPQQLWDELQRAHAGRQASSDSALLIMAEQVMKRADLPFLSGADRAALRAQLIGLLRSADDLESIALRLVVDEQGVRFELLEDEVPLQAIRQAMQRRFGTVATGASEEDWPAPGSGLKA